MTEVADDVVVADVVVVVDAADVVVVADDVVVNCHVDADEIPAMELPAESRNAPASMST